MVNARQARRVGLIGVALLSAALGPFPGPHQDAYVTMVEVVWAAPRFDAPAAFYAIWGIVYLAYAALAAAAFTAVRVLYRNLR